MTNIVKSQKDQEDALEHLFYELNMLASCSRLLRNAPTNGTLHNALLESFLIHARQLRVFYTAVKPEYDTDMVRCHFTEDPPHPKGKPVKDLNTEMAKISKHTAHLTWDRVIDKKTEWSHDKIAQILLSMAHHFGEHLRDVGSPIAKNYSDGMQFARLMYLDQSPITVGVFMIQS